MRKPYCDESFTDLWLCEILVKSPDHSWKISAQGPDSFLALISAVSLLNIELKKLRILFRKEGILRYLEDDAYLNFPMAELWQGGMDEGADDAPLTASHPTDVLGLGGQWGGHTDDQTDLCLCGHRFYDNVTGRWLTRDPIGYEITDSCLLINPPDGKP